MLFTSLCVFVVYSQLKSLQYQQTHQRYNNYATGSFFTDSEGAGRASRFGESRSRSSLRSSAAAVTSASHRLRVLRSLRAYMSLPPISGDSEDRSVSSVCRPSAPCGSSPVSSGDFEMSTFSRLRPTLPPLLLDRRLRDRRTARGLPHRARPRHLRAQRRGNGAAQPVAAHLVVLRRPRDA